MTGSGELVYVTQVAPYPDGPAGVHGVLPQSVIALGQLADRAGLGFRSVGDVRQIDAADLGRARVLALFTIGDTPWAPDQKAAILGALRSGSMSVLSIHAATDSSHTWDEYELIVGARFNGHPWTQDMTLEVCEPSHPALAHLGPTWAWHDEVYQFRNLRPDARVLLRVDESGLDLTHPAAKRPAYGFPLAWDFTEGAGRVFATSLGHFPLAWELPVYLRHLEGGLQWALGAGG